MDWGPQHQSALDALVDKVRSPPLLAYPDYNAPFIVHTDASKDILGDPGADSRVDKMFMVKVYCKIETSPWALTLTEPVPEEKKREAAR